MINKLIMGFFFCTLGEWVGKKEKKNLKITTTVLPWWPMIEPERLYLGSNYRVVCMYTGRGRVFSLFRLHAQCFRCLLS